MKIARARFPDGARGGFWNWLLRDRRRMWLAAWVLVTVPLALVSFFVSPLFEAAEQTVVLQSDQETTYSRRRSFESFQRGVIGRSRMGSHRFFRREPRRGVTAGAIGATGYQGADLPVHTARISAQDGLPEGPVRRADAPAIMSYQLKPAGELTAGEVANGASATLLDTLSAGATISVTFGCSHCDDSDQRQAPQHLRLDPAGGGTPRTQPLFFRFTPRSGASGPEGAPDVAPFVSLTFRVDGQEVDRWSIPVTVLAAATERPPLARPLSRTARSATRGARENGMVIQYADHPVHGNQGVVIEVYAPLELRPYLAPLEEPGTNVRIVGISAAGITYSLSDLSRTLDSIQSASDELLGDVDRAFRFAVDSSSRFPDDDNCPVLAEEAEDQRRIGAAIRTCISSEAQSMRHNLLPRPLQRVLFNLARCQRTGEAGAGERPLVVISGIRYGPIQFLPVDDIGDEPGRCSANLERRPQSQATNSTPSDDFLGLLLPIVIQPREVASALQGDNPVAGAPPRPERAILAGVYEETRQDTDDDPAYGFDEFARFAQAELHAVVSRNADAFRQRVTELGGSVDLVIINSHGERGRQLRDADRRLPDRILFSHFIARPPSASGSEAGDLRIPDRAVLTAAGLRGYFLERINAVGTMPLIRRPTVLLLACDMAPFRPGSTIPSAFFVGGARYVIASDSQVPAGTARQFGDAVVSRLARGASPARAVLEARRALFDEQGMIGPLLWNVVSAQGAGL
jgi:hypothetical protein